MTVRDRGLFRININRKKQVGDKQPMFDRGIISKPQDPDTRFELKLWAYNDQHGRLVLAGPSSALSMNASSRDPANAVPVPSIDAAKFASNSKSIVLLDAHQVILFENSAKIKSAALEALPLVDKEANEKRPDLWGFWNPGDGTEQLRVAAWARDGRYGRYLVGSTHLLQPNKKVATELAPLNRKKSDGPHER